MGRGTSWRRVKRHLTSRHQPRPTDEDSPTPELATTAFRKAIKPIAEVFKPDALPEAYVADAPTADERYYVPFTDTVSSRPLWISPQQNK